MRAAYFLLAAAMLLGMAGTANAHYLIEQETPAGHVCALNLELVMEGLETMNPDLILQGVVATDCEE
jgi:hypothetical protein